MINSEILSIDVNSHLQKVSSNIYKSPYHYTVELLRLALNRDASIVKIRIKRNKFEIYDNGSGIEKKQLNMLFNLYDKSNPPQEREILIDKIVTPQGIGFLSLFSVFPEKILIENVYNNKNEKYILKNNLIKRVKGGNLKKGSKITIIRRIKDKNDEKKILQNYMRFISKKVYINNKLYKKRKPFPGCMVYSKLKPMGFGKTGKIGIPLKNNFCRVWLTDSQIPWFYKAFSPYRGLLFESFIETKENFTTIDMDALSSLAKKHYRYLIKNYYKYPAKYKNRVEELIYKYFNATGKYKLINDFSQFKIYGKNLYLNLNQLKELSLKKTLYVKLKTEKDNFFYHYPETTIELSPRQLDFIIKQTNIKLTFLSHFQKKNSFKKIKDKISNLIKKFLSLFVFNRLKKIDKKNYTVSQVKFVELLRKHLKKPNIRKDRTYNEYKIVLLNSRGFIPVNVKKNDNKTIVLINNKHPLVKKAIKSINEDPRNIEFIQKALLNKNL